PDGLAEPAPRSPPRRPIDRPTWPDMSVAADPRVRGHDVVVEGGQRLPPPLEAPTLLQVFWKMFLMTPPKAKTTTTIRAAMPAMSRPYSTADAPRSSILASRALSMMRR